MNKTHKLVTYSLLIALVCVGTMFIKIHVPATNGYVNIPTLTVNLKPNS